MDLPEKQDARPSERGLPAANCAIYFVPEAFSLRGVTYTICSGGVMDAIGDLMIAPLQPWDALICASRVAKDVIEHVLREWGGYLSLRLGAQPSVPFEMPVIPLGVDCSRFDRTAAREESRKQLREKLGVSAEGVAVMFAGRLSFLGKAHPLLSVSDIPAFPQHP